MQSWNKFKITIVPSIWNLFQTSENKLSLFSTILNNTLYPSSFTFPQTTHTFLGCLHTSKNPILSKNIPFHELQNFSKKIPYLERKLKSCTKFSQISLPSVF